MSTALAAPVDATTVASRMQSARIASAVVFVLLVAAIALALRALGRKARRAEEEERLRRAFQEIEEDLRQERTPK